MVDQVTQVRPGHMIYTSQPMHLVRVVLIGPALWVSTVLDGYNRFPSALLPHTTASVP